MNKYFLILFLIFSSSNVLFAKVDAYMPCKLDKAKQEMRSKELALIVKTDQDARKNFENMSSEQMQTMAKEDNERRQRIGQIFGEGCISSAGDFAAAAWVFQHSDVPEHFFQTFLWAKKAVELGDTKQKRLMALGIDRYLVNIGQKQLFASQATKPNGELCWCLSRVEKSFPEEFRIKYMGNSLLDQISWLKELNKGKTCPNPYCSIELKDSPSGTIPGFW